MAVSDEVPAGSDRLAGLEKTHRLVQVTPFSQEALAYSLILPQDWKMEEDLGEQPGGVGVLTRIGLFGERVTPDTAIVQVTVTRMPLEVGLRNWLSFQSHRNGVRLSELKEERFACGPVATGVGEYGPPANKQSVWVVAHADGGCIFLVMAMVRATREAEVRRNLEIATRSFKLLHPTGNPLLEEWMEVEHGPPRFVLAYPASWVSQPVHEQLRGKAGVDIKLATDGQLFGYLRVKTIDPNEAGHQTPEQYVKVAVEELAEAKVSLKGSWSPDKEPREWGIVGLTVGNKAAGTLNGAAIEIRYALLDRPPLQFALTLLSTPQTDDPILWMRSDRAYEIALCTVRPTK